MINIWEAFHGNFILLLEFLPEIRWEEIAEQIFFHISNCCLICDTNPGFTSNKPIHDVLDYGDFIYIYT